MVATNTKAAGSAPIVVFPPRGLEIQGNVSASTFCNAGKTQFRELATYLSNLAHTLEADLTEMMKAAGADGQTSIGPITLGSSARAAAKKAVKPLRSMAAEAENMAKAFGVLDAQMYAHVFSVVQEIEEARERQRRGAGLKMGA
jgi:hypothetical protein